MGNRERERESVEHIQLAVSQSYCYGTSVANGNIHLTKQCEAVCIACVGVKIGIEMMRQNTLRDREQTLTCFHSSAKPTFLGYTIHVHNLNTTQHNTYTRPHTYDVYFNGTCHSKLHNQIKMSELSTICRCLVVTMRYRLFIHFVSTQR